jgi:hypothetical protein
MCRTSTRGYANANVSTDNSVRICTAVLHAAQRLESLKTNWDARREHDVLYMHLRGVPTTGASGVRCQWEGSECSALAMVECAEHGAALCCEHDRLAHCEVLHLHSRETSRNGYSQKLPPDQFLSAGGALERCACMNVSTDMRRHASVVRANANANANARFLCR